MTDITIQVPPVQADRIALIFSNLFDTKVSFDPAGYKIKAPDNASALLEKALGLVQSSKEC